MEKHIPLISTRTIGPLGLVHLPRVWLKLRLAAQDMLNENYRAGEGGFDGVLLNSLGIEPSAVVAFIKASQPSYLHFEDCVKKNADPESITPDAIAACNERILTFPKPEPMRTESLEFVGLSQSDKEWLGTDLNDLDDWHGIHLALLEQNRDGA